VFVTVFGRLANKLDGAIRDKHTSLLQGVINYQVKKFFNIGPAKSCINNLSTIGIRNRDRIEKQENKQRKKINTKEIG
jgi:hypothetical protein